MLEVINLASNTRVVVDSIMDYEMSEEDPLHILSESPSENDMVNIHLLTGLPIEDLKDALDQDEQPRVEDEIDEKPSFIKLVLRVPALNETDILEIQKETTYPMVIYLMAQKVVTVQPSFMPSILKRRKKGKRRAFDVSTKTTLEFLEQVVQAYERAVEVIDRTLEVVENDIFQATFRYHKSMRKVFQLARSATYLDAALNSNLNALRRMMRLDIYRNQPEIREALEDIIIIDLSQQLELLIIYKKLIENSIDGFASVVSNNQNDLLKLLASISLVLTIPTTLSSLYGMNVLLPFQDNSWAFWIIIGISALMILPTLYLLRRLTLL